MVGTSELDFILRFLAMAELKRASFCSFGLAKTFVGIALGFAALLSKELQALVNAVDIGRHGKEHRVLPVAFDLI